MSWYHATITTPAAFPAASAPHVDLGFEPSQIHLRNDGAAVVDVSFDGSTVAATVAANGGQEVLYVARAGVKKLWFRDGAGGGNLDVRANR